ncbi:glycosyltransferase family 8 C-terminal domain-containing protein, partial [Hafnia paralvei]
KPKSSSQFRYCAKHKFNQRKSFEGTYFYFMYFIKKMLG